MVFGLSWVFSGKMLAHYDDGSKVFIDASTLNDFARGDGNFCYTVNMNDTVREFTKLADYLVDVDGLNMSTFIQEIDINGLVFETHEDAGPFGLGPKSHLVTTKWYNRILLEGIQHRIIMK